MKRRLGLLQKGCKTRAWAVLATWKCPSGALLLLGNCPAKLNLLFHAAQLCGTEGIDDTEMSVPLPTITLGRLPTTQCTNPSKGSFFQLHVGQMNLEVYNATQ